MSRAASGAPIEDLVHELRAWVAKDIGAIARPRDVYIMSELPKTRSGKIMRRLLRDVAKGRQVGDTTTLADTQIMATGTDNFLIMRRCCSSAPQRPVPRQATTGFRGY